MVEWKKVLKISEDQLQHGLELHEKSISVDTLTGTVKPFTDSMASKAVEMLDAGSSSRDIRSAMYKMQMDALNDPAARKDCVDTWKKANVTAISATQFSNNFSLAVKSIADTHHMIEKFDDLLMKATGPGDIRRAKKEGKHAVIMNFQDTIALGGGSNFDEELDRINTFHSLGVRIIQLTYNLRNFVGDGSTERYESGLSYFGSLVVERLNELRIIVDTSHCGYKTTLDAVEASKVPAAATHTSCKSVYDHTRGKTDEELKAIAEKGGYIGTYMVPTFIGFEGGINDWLDHIDYVVDLVGAEHIGIGTDNTHRSANYPKRLALAPFEEMDRKMNWTGFRPEHRLGVEYSEGYTYPPYPNTDLAWVNWPFFSAALVSRGYSDEEIRGFIGGNFLRYWEKIAG
jgi:membrane dipeptidase